MWAWLGPRTPRAPEGRGLCVERSDLWESEDPETLRRAAATCLSCPLLDWCQDRARVLQRDGKMIIEGVWGGEIYPKVEA